jgi:hypothetical protein
MKIKRKNISDNIPQVFGPRAVGSGLFSKRSVVCGLPSLKGFTFIEIVMVMALMIIMVGLGAPMLCQVASGWQTTQRQAELTELGRVALELNSRDIRDIKNRTSLTAANSTGLSFTTADNRAIVLNAISGRPRRWVNGTSYILADAGTYSFIYYDANSTVISSPTLAPSSTNIRMIQMQINITEGNDSAAFRVKIAPRRLQ